MDEQKLDQFVEWLSSSVDEFKAKTPEEVVTILNKMAQTEEGMNTISGLINQFKQNSTGMFREGGKLDFMIKKFQNGGKSKKINPNDSKEILKSLNNHAGDRGTPHDTFTTTGLVRDSLIKIGYNPTVVNRLARPIIKTAEQKIVQGNYPAPEDNTQRQFNLLKFLQPEIYYWAGGTADTEQAKSNNPKLWKFRDKKWNTDNMKNKLTNLTRFKLG